MADYINEVLVRLTTEQAKSVNEQVKAFAKANGKLKSRDIAGYIKVDEEGDWTYCPLNEGESTSLPFVSEGNQNLTTYPKKHEKYGQKVPFEDNYIALLRKWGETPDERYSGAESLNLLTDEQVEEIIDSIEISSGSYNENDWIYSISGTNDEDSVSFDFRDRRIDDVNKPLEIAGGATIGLSDDPEMRSKFTIMGETENQDGSTYGRLVDIYGDLKENLDKWGHQIPNENYPKVYINRGEDRFNGETWVDGDSLTDKAKVGREVIITLNAGESYSAADVLTLEDGKVLKDGEEIGTYVETGANFGLGFGTIESTKEIVSHSTIAADHGLIIEDGVGDNTDVGISKYYIKDNTGMTIAIKFNDDGDKSRETNGYALTIKHDGAKIHGWTHIADEENKNSFRVENGTVYYPTPDGDQEYSNDKVVKECYFLPENEDKKGDHEKDSHYGHWCIQKDGQEVYIIDEWPGFLYHEVDKQIDKIVSDPNDTTKTLYLYRCGEDDCYLVNTDEGIVKRVVKKDGNETDNVYKNEDGTTFYKLEKKNFERFEYVVDRDENGDLRTSIINEENGIVVSITSKLPERIVPQLHQVYQVSTAFSASDKEEGARPSRQYNNGFAVNEGDYLYWTGAEFKKIESEYSDLIKNNAYGSLSIGSRNSDTLIGRHSLEVGTGVLAKGGNSVAGGLSSSASGANSVAFGNTTSANGENSIAFGQETTANGSNSAAFGQKTIANGANSFAGGLNSSVSGIQSFAFGNKAFANGENSVAFGQTVSAKNPNSVVFGSNNTTDLPYQFLLGQYASTTRKYSAYLEAITNKLLFAIGNGTKSEKANLFDVSEDGTGYFAGGLEVSKKSALKDKATIGESVNDHKLALEVLKQAQFDQKVTIKADEDEKLSLYNEGASQFDKKLTIGTEESKKINDKGFCDFTGLEVFGEIRNWRIPEALYTKATIGNKEVYNQFADKFFVNSSISSATATFRGSYSFREYGFEESEPTINEYESALPTNLTKDNEFTVGKFSNKYYIVLEKETASEEDNEVEYYWAEVKEAGTLGELPYAYMVTGEYGAAVAYNENKEEISRIWYKKKAFNTVNYDDATEWLNGYTKKLIVDGEVEDFTKLPSAAKDYYHKIYSTSTDGKHYRCDKNTDGTYVWEVPTECETRADLPELSKEVLEDWYYVKESKEYLICTIQSGTESSYKWNRVSSPADKNDYCFVQIATPREFEDCVKFDAIYDNEGNPIQKRPRTENNEYPVTITYWRFKYCQTVDPMDPYKITKEGWQFEYQVNNSGFTQAQWDTINSGVSSQMVSALQDSIDGEIEDRKKADTTLQKNIDTLSDRVAVNGETLDKHHTDIADLYSIKMDQKNPSGAGIFELTKLTYEDGTTTGGYGIFANGIYEGSKDKSNKCQTLSEINTLLKDYYKSSEVDTKLKEINSSIGTIETSIDGIGTSIGTINNSIKTINASIGKLGNTYVTLDGDQTITGKKTFSAAPVISSFINKQNETINLPTKGGTLALKSDIQMDIDWNSDSAVSVKWTTKGLPVAHTFCRQLGNSNLYLLKFDGSVDQIITNVACYTMKATVNNKLLIPLVGAVGTSSAGVLKSIGQAYGFDYDVDRGNMYLYIKTTALGTNYYCNVLCTIKE